MDLRRLRAGEWIAAASGGALLASLFLPWYDGGAADLSGWEALGAIDVVVALVAAAAIALLVVTATQGVPAVPVMMDALVTLAGIVGALLVLGLLKGSFIFLGDLVRNIPRPLQVDFLVAASYGSGGS